MTLRPSRPAATLALALCLGFGPGPFAGHLPGAATDVGAAQAAACTQPRNLDAVARDLERAVNDERRRAGLPRVALSPRLNTAAQGHACDMAARGYFGHRTPDGARPSDRVRRVGLRSCLTAENIAAGQRSTAQVHGAWLASPGHRANILRRGVSRIGVGMAQPAGGGRAHWVMVFADPC